MYAPAMHKWGIRELGVEVGFKGLNYCLSRELSTHADVPTPSGAESEKLNAMFLFYSKLKY